MNKLVKQYFLYLLALFLLLIFATETAALQPKTVQAKLIPDAKTYASFLHGEYQANKLNILVFKDPFCPYCIRAIDKLDELKNYNVYVFWSPILGTGSVKRVDSFFKCDNFANATVLNAVKTRSQPNCEGQIKQDLLTLNNEMVSNYAINAVPSYFIQGKATSFQTLAKLAPTNPAINGIKLKWQRYAIMQQKERVDSRYLSMHIPQNRINDVTKLLTEYNPQYVFLPAQYAINHPEFLKCANNQQQCIQENGSLYKKRIQEFELLLGHSYNKEELVIVDYKGNMTAL